MATRWLRHMVRSVPWGPVWVGVVAAAVTAMVAVRPAGALDDEPTEPPPVLGCLSQVKGRIEGVTQVTLGQSTTVSWGVTVPSTCTGVTVQATGPGLFSTARSGSKVVVPLPEANGYALYQVRAFKDGLVHPVANWAIKVAPVSWTAYGRTVVQLTDSRQNAAFVEAIATPNTTVVLADHVELDLSCPWCESLPIARGVHILGGRSSTNPGPRIFTTAIRTAGPQPLFAIGAYHDADGVRISGVRIDGGDMGIAGNGITQDNDPVTPVGITVNSSVNVEIAHSEIYGWSGIAVQVQDTRNRLNLDNASAVWIHDNYIHHNRRYRHEGYGVATAPDAYALLERNVFDSNRHALESSGASGAGYRAYHNLVLDGGGENSLVTYTHQFDVHGTMECGGKDAYCGQAGEYYDYRYNTLWYSAGTPIKVRGIPTLGAEVTQNIFYTDEEPVVQTVGDNVTVWENIDAYATGRPQGFVACDFDGDGRADPFLGTGVTWWYQGVTGQWQYLNTSRTMAGELTFRDVDLDGYCDVKENATQRIFRGGRATLLVAHAEAAAQWTDLVWTHPGSAGTARVWQLDAALQAVQGEVTVTQNVSTREFHLLGTGDFNADGATDLLWRDRVERAWPDGSVAAQVVVTLLDADGQVVDSSGFPGRYTTTMPLATQLAGIGDFNADGRADILWRRENEQLELWFAGESGNSALVNYNNDLTIDQYGLGHPQEAPVPVDWQVQGVADFNGDGYSDILWRHEGGQVCLWYMVHAVHVGEGCPGGIDPTHDWAIQGVGDFDADGHADILWRNTLGQLAMWFRGLYEYGQAYPTWQNFSWHVVIVPLEWQIQAVGDFNADGRADIVWRHDDGTVSLWKMNGGWYIGESTYLPMDPAWELRGLLPQAPHRLDLQ